MQSLYYALGFRRVSPVDPVAVVDVQHVRIMTVRACGCRLACESSVRAVPNAAVSRFGVVWRQRAFSGRSKMVVRCTCRRRTPSKPRTSNRDDKMEHMFLRTPDHYSFDHALRRAEVLGLGGTPELAEVLLTTRIAEDFTNAERWRQALHWLVRCGDPSTSLGFVRLSTSWMPTSTRSSCAGGRSLPSCVSSQTGTAGSDLPGWSPLVPVDLGACGSHVATRSFRHRSSRRACGLRTAAPRRTVRGLDVELTAAPTTCSRRRSG
jgi:hypothetical protein